MDEYENLDVLERQLEARGLLKADAEEAPATPEALKGYLEAGDEAQARRCLDRMRMLEAEDAGELLLSALSCSAALFKRLLGHCPRGEYAGSAVLECWRKSWGKKARYEIRVEGTLLTLAAAMDLPEHIRLLLKAGYDPNSASLRSAAGIRRQLKVPKDMVEHLHRGVLCGCLGSMFGHLDCELDTSEVWGRSDFIGEATPLAAAVYLGNLDAVRELLRWEGVWRCECRPVSMVLALPWRRGDKDYEKACRLVRRDANGAVRPLDLASVAWFCGREMLEKELTDCAYGTAALQTAALELLRHQYRPVRDIAQQLRLLYRADPGVLQGEEVLGLLALKAVREPENGALWALLEDAAAGGTLDLSYAFPGLTDIDWRVMTTGLRRLSERFRLVSSRDVVARDASVRQLQALMKYVRFLPPDSETGVSGLTCALISTKNVPLVKKALEQDLLPGNEPLEELLILAGPNAALRALLIAGRRERQETVEHNWEHFDYRCFSLREPEGEDDHVERLRYGEIEPSRWEVFSIDTAPMGDTLMGSYSDFCFLARDWEVLADLAESRAIPFVSTSEFQLLGEFQNVVRCSMTPLCTAALGGQTETVRRLLELGYDPDERDIGMPSYLNMRLKPESPVPVTPLLAALLCRHWDTAALLLEHGAVCDLTERSVLWLWKQLWGDSLYGTASCYLKGFLDGRCLRKRGEARS